ncbi:MAG: hypothetical protein ACOYL0_16700, partial [Limnohabitans sp.]
EKKLDFLLELISEKNFMHHRSPHYLALAVLLLSPTLAFAYIGPGLGAGAIAAVLGILGGVALLVVGVLWYPLKRLFQYFRSKKQ